MVPQSWIIDCLKIYRIADKVIKFIEEIMKKLERGIDSRKKKFSWCENPEGYIPGRWAITITICNNDDALSHIFWKCTGSYKLTKSQEKD